MSGVPRKFYIRRYRRLGSPHLPVCRYSWMWSETQSTVKTRGRLLPSREPRGWVPCIHCTSGQRFFSPRHTSFEGRMTSPSHTLKAGRKLGWQTVPQCFPWFHPQALNKPSGLDPAAGVLSPGPLRPPARALLLVTRPWVVAQTVKNPPAMRENHVRSLGWEDPLEKDPEENFMDRGTWRATQSMGSQTVGHDWGD